MVDAIVKCAVNIIVERLKTNRMTLSAHEGSILLAAARAAAQQRVTGKTKIRHQNTQPVVVQNETSQGKHVEMDIRWMVCVCLKTMHIAPH